MSWWSSLRNNLTQLYTPACAALGINRPRPVWIIGTRQNLDSWYPSSNSSLNETSTFHSLLRRLHKVGNHELYAMNAEQLLVCNHQKRLNLPWPSLIVVTITPEDLGNAEQQQHFQKQIIEPLALLSGRFKRPTPVIWLIKEAQDIIHLLEQSPQNSPQPWGSLWGPTWNDHHAIGQEQFESHFQAWLLEVERGILGRQTMWHDNRSLAAWHATPYAWMYSMDTCWRWFQMLGTAPMLKQRAILVSNESHQPHTQRLVDTQIHDELGVEAYPHGWPTSPGNTIHWQSHLGEYAQLVDSGNRQLLHRLFIRIGVFMLTTLLLLLGFRTVEFFLAYHEMKIVDHPPSQTVDRAYWATRLATSHLGRLDPLFPLSNHLKKSADDLLDHQLIPMLDRWLHLDNEAASSRLKRLQVNKVQAMLSGHDPMDLSRLDDWLAQHHVNVNASPRAWHWLLEQYAASPTSHEEQAVGPSSSQAEMPAVDTLTPQENRVLLYLSKQPGEPIRLNLGDDTGMTVEGVFSPDILYTHLAALQAACSTLDCQAGVQHPMLMEYFYAWWSVLQPLYPFTADSMGELASRLQRATATPEATWKQIAQAFGQIERLNNIDPTVRQQSRLAQAWAKAMSGDHRDVWKSLAAAYVKTWPSEGKDTGQSAFLMAYKIMAHQQPEGLIKVVHEASAEDPNNQAIYENLMQITWRLTLSEAHRFLNEKWRLTVFTYYSRYLAKHYPFDRQAKEEVDLKSLDNFLGPKGLIEAFDNTLLAPFIINTTAWDFTPQRFAGQAMSFSKHTYTVLTHLHLLQQMFYSSGERHPHFEFTLIPVKRSANLNSFVINSGGEEHLFDAKHDDIIGVHWPSQGDQSVTLMFKNDLGTGQIITFNSLWAWLRILDSAHIQPTPSEGHYTVTFSKEGYEATYELIMGEPIHPLMGHMLEDLQLKDTL